MPDNIAEFIVLAAGVLIATGVCAKALGKFWRFIRRVGRIHDQLEVALPLIPRIVAEFRPNGGSSMRDRIDHTFKRIDEFIAYQHNRNHDIIGALFAQDAREWLIANGYTPPSHLAPKKIEQPEEPFLSGVSPENSPLNPRNLEEE